MNVCTFRLRRAAGALSLAALALALVILLRCTGAYVLLAGGTVRRLPVYSVEREDQSVSITFDCAWGTEHTDAILQALSDYNVKATFFMVEFWTEKYSSYVERIYEALAESDYRDRPCAYDYLTQTIDFLFDNEKRKALQKFWTSGIKVTPRVEPG